MRPRRWPPETTSLHPWPETDKNAPDASFQTRFPARPRPAPQAIARSKVNPPPRAPGRPSARQPALPPRGPAEPGRPVLHHQARDAGAVVRELLVAGHAVDVDDVDDGVLGADPHLALLHHHHAVLTGARREAEAQGYDPSARGPALAAPRTSRLRCPPFALLPPDQNVICLPKVTLFDTHLTLGQRGLDCEAPLTHGCLH